MTPQSSQRIFALAVSVPLLGSCSVVLPAAWRAFRVEPEDAAPVIARSLDERRLAIAGWNRERDEIVTAWVVLRDGGAQTRERYRVRWEKNHNEETLTVFVRHEAEDRRPAEDGLRWGPTHHDAGKERALLDEISKQVVLAYGDD